MSNLFFRTNIAPYRVDTYNALHEKLNCDLFFYWDFETSQNLDMSKILNECKFTPGYLKGVRLNANTRKICTEIWSILREKKPDIVIVPEFQILTIQVLLYKWIFRKNFKVISMCDDSYDMLNSNNDFSKIHRFARKILAPRVDEILLVDSRSVEWYQSNYGKGLWLPIVRDEHKERVLYEEALPQSRTLLEKYNIENKKVLLYVGRLVEIKNIRTLIAAIGKTSEDFVTVVVGDGCDKELFIKEASTLNKPILFVGHFENQDIRAWYNIADVFVLPSYREPFGAVTNEALLAGCYSLISEKAGSACLIEEGVNGELFPPMDVECLAMKIDATFAKIAHSNLHLKDNKMLFSFNHIIDSVFNKLKS